MSVRPASFIKPLKSTDLREAADVIYNFQNTLETTKQDRECLYDQLEFFASTMPVAEKSALLRSCSALLASDIRLRIRDASSEKKSAALRYALQSASLRTDRVAYTKTLVQSLLYNRPSAHEDICFDLVLPEFLDLVVESVANFYPPLFAPEKEIAQDIVFYTRLFTDMLQAPQKFSAIPRFLLEKKLVRNFETIWFLGSRALLRPLRNAHQKLLRRLVSLEETSKDHIFPQRAANAKRRIGFWAEGDSYGHGWPSVRRIAQNLDPNKATTVLVTWSENPSQADRGIESCVIQDWSRAVSDIRNLDLDVLFFCTSLDRSAQKKPMQLGHYRLARHQTTAFMNNTTTAAPFMDSIITSASMDAPDLHKQLFFEPNIITTQNLPFAFDPDTYFPRTHETVTRADLGIPENAKIMTCGNSVQIKMNEDYLRFVAKFLARHKEVTFVIMPSFGNEDIIFYELSFIFSAQGVEPERIKIIAPPSRERQYGILSLADLYLDFFPFSGANSLFDPLYLGVPVLSLLTVRKMRCAQGAAILEDLGLEDYVAKSLPELEEKAEKILFGPRRSVTRAQAAQKTLSCSAFNGKSAQELASILMALAQNPPQREPFDL